VGPAGRARTKSLTYFAVAILLVAVALAVLHWWESRSDKRQAIVTIAVALLALVVGIASIVAVVRTGDAGARSVWHAG
jgi:membrane protein YdbS with pleckstrin-like domain